MPDTKITALTAIGANPIIPATFPIPMVDLTDTSMAASGTTKKVTVNQILGAGGTATLASATITGDLTVDTSTLKVDSANNRVGIGTASPTSKLHVFGSGTNTFLTISDVGANYNIALGTQNADIAQLAIFNTTIASGSKDFWLTALSHTFNTWNGSAYSNRFVIASDGVATWSNVGGVAGTAMTLNSTGLAIGDSPSYKLHVTASSRAAGANYSTSAMEASTVAYVRGAENDLSKASTLLLTQFNGSAAISAGYTATYRSFLAFGVNNGSASVVESMRLDYLGNLGIGVAPSAWGTYKALQVTNASLWGAVNNAYVGANYYFDGSNRKYIANGFASEYSQASGVHAWFNAVSGTAGNAITFTQAMTLDASGNLSVGATSVLNGVRVFAERSGGSVAGFNRTTSDGTNVLFYRQGLIVGDVSVTTTGTTFNSTSDYRLKEAIQPLVGGLARVSALKPSIYKWKSNGSNGEGFLAHELAEVVPAAVTGEKDAVNEDGSIKAQSIDMSRIVPILVAAIQELTAEVNALKNA